ncbi:hypothetical protein, partial [Rhizobium sp. 2TAF27]|uniref:hypothetical protein n=1 Tax=Rhizobium sp. 2TAF27 TaxID=3233013 RepID=UPI003F9DF4FA
QSSHYCFLFVFEPTEVMPRHRTRLVPSRPENNFQASCQTGRIDVAERNLALPQTLRGIKYRTEE